MKKFLFLNPFHFQTILNFMVNVWKDHTRDFHPINLISNFRHNFWFSSSVSHSPAHIPFEIRLLSFFFFVTVCMDLVSWILFLVVSFTYKLSPSCSSPTRSPFLFWLYYYVYEITSQSLIPSSDHSFVLFVFIITSYVTISAKCLKMYPQNNHPSLSLPFLHLYSSISVNVQPFTCV